MRHGLPKIRCAIISALFVWTLLASPAPLLAASLTPEEILDRMDDLYRGKSSSGIITMAITTIHWKRTLKIKWWSKGKEMSLARIVAPKKEKGTATLRSGTDIWNYLPKVKRIIKLPSSMMSASWMGSHFTNDDLVKESRFTEDYDFTSTFEGIRRGFDVIEITCIPKPRAAVVWGKVVITVRRSDYLPLDSKYYDEDMRLARTMTFLEIGRLGDRTLPKFLIIVPENKPGEKTEIRYEDFSFDIGLQDGFFSLRNLQK